MHIILLARARDDFQTSRKISETAILSSAYKS